MTSSRLSFNDIFKAMEAIAAAGNEFFADAVNQYLEADEDTKQDMRDWLEESFANHNLDIMSLETALLLMQYAA